MRRLRDFQIVGLGVSGTDATCRVVAVDGGVTVLEPENPAGLAQLVLPGPATLSFDTPRHPVLLAGNADAGPIDGTLGFWVTDAVTLAPQRLRPRLKADLAVRVTPLDAGRRRTAFASDHATTDISAGGVAIAGITALPGALLALELVVPGMERPVACCGRVVRRRPDGTTAVAFTDLDPAIADTLDRLIFGVRRRVARQAFLLRESA
ncbi:MAG: PilZ protein [Conexibacter sp.]|nr:PilZ protein [Conexibacter sp.]